VALAVLVVLAVAVRVHLVLQVRRELPILAAVVAVEVILGLEKMVVMAVQAS
jgi:hypothetical protein